MNTSLLKTRLSQYGLVWAGTFLIVLLLACAATLLLKQDFVGIADLLLTIGLGAIGVLVVAFIVATVLAAERMATKAVLLILGVLLILPLLWSPVLAVVITAHFTGAAVEYSGVYAGFRALVSRIVFPLVQAIFGGSLIETVWSAFQAVATIIGFIVSVLTLWPYVRRAIAPPPIDDAEAT